MVAVSRRKPKAVSSVAYDQHAVLRLEVEAKLYREDVIALRFGWDLSFLRQMAARHQITLLGLDAYMAEHPTIAARETAAAEQLRREARHDRRRAPATLQPPRERRDFYVPCHVADSAGHALTAEAERRGVARSALLATIIETVVERGAWDSVLP